MSTKTQKLSALVSVIVAGILIPAGVWAQAPQPSNGTAVALESRAHELLTNVDTWVQGAKVLVQAAEQRVENDPVGIDDLMLAAGAFYYGHKPAKSLETFIIAGERAQAIGDVVTAAFAFSRGAIVAHELKNGTTAIALMQRATRLAASPLLNEAQKAAIREQFTPVVQVAKGS